MHNMVITAKQKLLISENQLTSLTCVVLPAKGRFCQKKHIPLYENCYQFWHQQLQAAFAEENNTALANDLPSDGFIDQDQGIYLLHDNQPIGMFMCRWIDTSITPNQSLRALTKCYPEFARHYIIDHHHQMIMTMGQLAIAPAWRSRVAGFGVSDILYDFIIREFQHSRASLLLTTTRNNRKTNALVMRRGAFKLGDNGIAFGVASDVMALTKENIQTFEPRILSDAAETLWNNRINGWIQMPYPFKEEIYA